MKKWVVVSCLILTVMLSSVKAKIIADNDKDVKRIADPIMDNILEGMKIESYEIYPKDFDKTMKRALDEKAFLLTNSKIEDRIGNYQSRIFLGFLNQDDFTVILYKGKFNGTKNDVLMKLVLDKKKQDKIEVSGLWFQ